jgi:hypothetical protein
MFHIILLPRQQTTLMIMFEKAFGFHREASSSDDTNIDFLLCQFDFLLRCLSLPKIS